MKHANKEFYSEVSRYIEIKEFLYKSELASIKKKLKNLKLINVDSFVKLIDQEIDAGNLKNKYEILNYIEDIITD